MFSIRAFVTVVKFQNFTKAANYLKTSTATLSRAVTNLEAHTQTRLLYRSSRHVVLAESARDYFDVCSEMLEQLADGERNLKAVRDDAMGHLRIVAHPYAIEAGFPELLDQYRSATSKATVELTVSSGILKLELGECDLALYPRHLIADSRAVCRHLISSPPVLVASPTYIAKQMRGRVPENLSGHVFIVCASSRVSTGALGGERTGAGQSLGTPSSLLVVDESAAVRLALDGHGIALLPAIIAERYMRRRALMTVFQDFEVNHPEAELDVAYLRKQLMPRRIKDFIDMCLGYYQKYDQSNALPSEATIRMISA